MIVKALFVFSLFLSPYFLIFILSPSFAFNLDNSWLMPFIKGLEQAFLSALGSLVLGVVLSQSLFATKSLKSLQRTRLVLLSPQLVPPIFVILSILNFSKSLNLPHQGLVWVVFAHSLLNSGLFAVAFHSYFMSHIQLRLEVAETLGAGFWIRFKTVVLPLSLPVLAQNFLLVFALCLVSFSIPFVLSGPVTTSLEVYIFRIIRSEGQWGMGILYSLIQTLSVALLSVVFWRLKIFSSSHLKAQVYYSKRSSLFQSLAYAPLVLLVGFWIKDIITHLFDGEFRQSLFVMMINPQFLISFLNTLLIFSLVFLIHLLFSILVTFGEVKESIIRFFQGYLAPSLAVLGFSMMLLPGQSELMIYIKTSFCFSLLTFPFLFRLQLIDQLRFLKNQIEIAKVLGASSAQIYFQITWPQIQSKVILAAGLSALWSLGDFAVSTFFISGDQTLGLMVIDLIGRYRLEQASFLSLMILILGLLIFQLLQRVFRYVGH